MQQASDIHLSAGYKPVLRKNGKLEILSSFSALSSEVIRSLCYGLLTEKQQALFEEKQDLDFSFFIEGVARFRGSLFFQREQISVVLRCISDKIPSLESLGVPSQFSKVSDFHRGLVLVVGPTGSGKTTTLAALLDSINTYKPYHIVTIEDPIEFYHTNKKSIVTQREVGRDVDSFPQALKAVLRQDPDVCLVGELRDPETMKVALSLAETGHLVFASLHTGSAAETLVRIINAFSEDVRDTIRMQLSLVLQAILSQRLIPLDNDDGRVLATELCLPNTSIRNIIREDKIHQLYGAMQLGQGQTGMHTMNQSLARLVNKGIISLDKALSYSPEKKELAQLLHKVAVG